MTFFDIINGALIIVMVFVIVFVIVKVLAYIGVGLAIIGDFILKPYFMHKERRKNKRYEKEQIHIARVNRAIKYFEERNKQL